MDVDEGLQPDYQDMVREYPAVRCRECGTITHVCTAEGTFKEYTCGGCVSRRQPCLHTARQVRTRDTEIHLDDGWKLATSNHRKGCSKPPNNRARKGCSKPPSRLALQMWMRDQAPELVDSALGDRLGQYMTEREVKQAANELLEYLRDR